MTGNATDPEPSTSLPMEVHTMLLSRVAEQVYWAGRYLERAEATARLVRTHTELYLDLPLSAGLGWAPLLAVTGSDAAYEQVSRASNNLPDAKILLASYLNIRDLLSYDKVVLPLKSLDVLSTNLGKE